MTRSHSMTCWECGGSGVMAKAGRMVPCEVCGDEYGRIEVVSVSQLRGAVEALRDIRAICDPAAPRLTPAVFRSEVETIVNRALRGQ